MGWRAGHPDKQCLDLLPDADRQRYRIAVGRSDRQQPESTAVPVSSRLAASQIQQGRDHQFTGRSFEAATKKPSRLCISQGRLIDANACACQGPGARGPRERHRTWSDIVAGARRNRGSQGKCSESSATRATGRSRRYRGMRRLPRSRRDLRDGSDNCGRRWSQYRLVNIATDSESVADQNAPAYCRHADPRRSNCGNR